MALLYSQRCLRKGTSTGSRLELQPTVAHHALAAIEDKGLIGKLDLNRAILAKRMEVSDGKKRCLHIFKSTVALPSKARSCLFDVLFCIPEETLGVTTLPQVVNFSRGHPTWIRHFNLSWARIAMIFERIQIPAGNSWRVQELGAAKPWSLGTKGRCLAHNSSEIHRADRDLTDFRSCQHLMSKNFKVCPWGFSWTKASHKPSWMKSMALGATPKTWHLGCETCSVDTFFESRCFPMCSPIFPYDRGWCSGITFEISWIYLNDIWFVSYYLETAWNCLHPHTSLVWQLDSESLVELPFP